MRANHKTGRQSDGKMRGIWEKIKERLGFGRKAEGDKEDDRVMYIIAGLGNPTREYEKTRHNVGFEVIDVLADRLGTTVEEKKFKGCYGRGIIGGQKVLLLKPQTFMNLSGESVRAAADFYKVDPEHIIVIYDDISLDVGQIRIRKKGSAGGHNGLKNIIKMLGHDTFIRVRMGVGEKPKTFDLADYVLGHFPAEERSIMDEAAKTAAEAIRMIITENADTAMNHFNSKKA